ncbi:MAG TPA: hypothetical protein VKB50_01130 [Vicinamibacterales bacterium]|nr:hypothetical protein [Vicinamibacterales bacterium]
MLIKPRQLPLIPASLPVYRTISPGWTVEGARRFALRLGVDAPAKESKLWLVCRNEQSSVEVFRASHSARVTRRSFDREGTTSGQRRIPSDEVAIERANEFVEGLRDIHMSRPLPPTLSRIEAITKPTYGAAQLRRTVAVQVNYRFSLDDLPLRGPGAKAQITMGTSGEIDHAYLFWRQLERTEESWTTRPAAAALDALAASRYFASVIRKKDVEVLQIEAGWLCLPPAVEQKTLFPIYRIRGRVLVEVDAPPAEADALREFIVYVAAARTPPQLSPPNTVDGWPTLVIA